MTFLITSLALAQPASAEGPYDGEYRGRLPPGTCTGTLPEFGRQELQRTWLTENEVEFSVANGVVAPYNVSIDSSGRAEFGGSASFLGQGLAITWAFSGGSSRVTFTQWGPTDLGRPSGPGWRCTQSGTLSRVGGFGVVNPIGDVPDLLFWGGAALTALSMLGLGARKLIGAVSRPQRLAGIRPDVGWGNPPTPPPPGAVDQAGRPLPRWRTRPGPAPQATPITPHTPLEPQYATPAPPAQAFQGAPPSAIGPGGQPLEGPGVTAPLPAFPGVRFSVTKVGPSVQLDWDPPLHDVTKGELLGYEIYRYEPTPDTTGWEFTSVDTVPADTTSQYVLHKEPSRRYGVRPIYRTPDGIVFGAGSQP